MKRKTKQLNAENNRLDEQINKENQPIFTDIICYLRGANLSDNDIEVVRHDLTEMVLSAQRRGENISSIIGDDVQGFCDQVIAALPPKSKKQKLLDYLYICFQGCSILFAINIIISRDTIAMIEHIITGQTVNFNLSISAGSVISIFLILLLANFIVNTITKNAFHQEIKHKKAFGIVIGVIVILLMLAIAWLGQITLCSVNIFVAIFLTVILYLAASCLN